MPRETRNKGKPTKKAKPVVNKGKYYYFWIYEEKRKITILKLLFYQNEMNRMKINKNVLYRGISC
ncbi:hypothetical protein K502DRAFT_324246 [Neoconidiobolus thromboides FSU 785]|nr:hypothetical protein K502DRAFT_324246 [Neoconidiobolus thromboides FSU 785]